VIKEGELVWTFESGRQTYNEDAPLVTAETIYDVASLTKVTSTTPVAMKLVEQKKLPLDEPINEFIPEFAGGNKDKITIRHMLTHSAGLQPYDEFPLGTTGEEIVSSIVERPLVAVPGEKYIYSDFGPILLGKIMEKVTGRALENLATSYVFRPLGMTSTLFNPDSTFLPRIAPTEIDEQYERGLVRGIVHDERAWQLGGVAGHAGLFSTATDLARYAQMMINRGFYGGRRYFKRSTIEDFTRRQEIPTGSERTLGWDTPSEEGSLAGDLFSPGSYGHTGFTGTSMWIDPNRKIAVILLTNHVHPSRGKLGEESDMWKAEMREVRREFQNGVMKILLEKN
jgi:CubicO group peptidase (beta-lactamase class C family)